MFMQDSLSAAEKQLSELKDEVLAGQRKAVDDLRIVEEGHALEVQKLSMERTKIQVMERLGTCPRLAW